MRKWATLILMCLLPAVVMAKPRNPLPATPDQVWQNDLDLEQDIANISTGTTAVSITSTTLPTGSSNYAQINPTTQQPGAINVNSSSFTVMNSTYATATSSITTPIVAVSSINSTSGNIGITILPSGGVLIKGTTTNDATPTGDYGEYVTANSNSNTACTTSDQYADLTSISLTKGQWSVSAVVRFNHLTSTTFTGVEAGISITSGNSSTGLTATDNDVPLSFPTVIIGNNNAFPTIAIPDYKLTFSADTTVYLKYLCTYTGSAPAANGSIKAVRIR